MSINEVAQRRQGIGIQSYNTEWNTMLQYDIKNINLVTLEAMS
jgi:hypothetical protein